MIPDGSTPIKNEILIEIFAKGKLTRMEMRIASYIMRWSWGFDDKERRQDWTKSIMEKQIAEDLGVHKVVVCRTIKQMIQRKILLTEKLTKGLCYQFNEHYENWKKLTEMLISKKLTKKLIKVNRNVNKIDKKLTEKLTSGAGKKELASGSEVLKETNLKETLKEKPHRLIKKVRYKDKHLTLAKLLEKLIKENKPDYVFVGGHLERWADEIRLMEEKDGRNLQRVSVIIGWALKHSFWKTNILSGSKLRKQFDRLEMQYKEEESGSQSRGHYKETGKSRKEDKYKELYET